ncbi:MAG: recombination-associated protein RdgC [Pseudomonadota bacterium]
MFSNLSVFALSAPMPKADDVNHQLAAGALEPCGRLEPSSAGWVSPLGVDAEQLTHGIGEHLLIRYAIEEKVLPAAVIKEALEDRVAKAAEQTGHPTGRRERLRMKDEVMMDLLPRAFVKPRRVDAWLDLGKGWLGVDSTSKKTVDDLVTLLRMNLTGLAVAAPDVKTRACQMLTRWLKDGNPPTGFTLGDECDLRDERDAASTIRCRRQDLDRSDIRRHLDQGMQAFRLGLVWQERLSFSLSEDLTLSRVKPLDLVQSQLSDVRADNPAEELDARFAVMSLEYRALVEDLSALFAWPERA